MCCGDAFGQGLSQPKPKPLAPTGRDWNAIERDFIAAHPKLGRRVQDSLFLRLHDGSEIEVADAPKCAEVEDLLACNNHKTLVTYYKEPGLYLLYVKLLKGFRYLMVDDATGATHVLAGAPIWSPDRVTFVTISQSPDEPSSFNGFELWSTADGQITKRLSYQLPLYGTVEFDKWVENDECLIHVHSGRDNQQSYEATELDVKQSDDGVSVEARFDTP